MYLRKTGFGILLLSLLFGQAASAEEYSAGDGFFCAFDGQGIESSFLSPGELSSELSGLQPGDSMTFSVRVENRNDTGCDWYLSNEILESMEDKSPANGGAYGYGLLWTPDDGETRELYRSVRVGGEREGDGREGLHDVEGLSEFFYLDHTAGGSGGEVSLTVSLNGETQVNSYQNTLAKLALSFAVEDTGDKPGDPGYGGAAPGGGSSGSAADMGGSGRVFRTGSVRTGDAVPLFTWMFLFFVSAAFTAWALRMYLRERKEEKNEDT